MQLIALYGLILFHGKTPESPVFAAGLMHKNLENGVTDFVVLIGLDISR